MTQTELEKQINKILLKASFLDSNGSLGICQSYFKNVTKEIASLKMEGFYEFVEYTSEYHFDGFRWCVEGQELMTTDELYLYWQTNVKDK